MCFDLRSKNVLWNDANLLVDDFATLKNKKGRNVPDSKLGGEFALTVYVHLADRSAPFKVNGQLRNDGPNHAAWSAPFCPKVHEDWLVGAKYEFFEVCSSEV